MVSLEYLIQPKMEIKKKLVKFLPRVFEEGVYDQMEVDD
jgi:hypothetical protein